MRATSTSNGIPRSGTQARARPGVSAVGKSFRLCTAASIRLSSKARSNSRTKTPSLPICAILRSVRRSPCVVINSTSTVCPSWRSRSTIKPVCVRARALARVPTRMIRGISILAISCFFRSKIAVLRSIHSYSLSRKPFFLATTLPHHCWRLERSALATTAANTALAPALTIACRQVASVAPLVTTSSTNKIDFPSTRRLARKAA